MSQQSFSCACGQCTVTVAEGAPCAFSAICHCADCRSITGSPYFWGNAFMPNQVSVTGETIAYTHIKNTRHSCAKCGSFVYEPVPSFGLTMLPAARLPAPAAPMMHIFVKSKVYPLPEDGLPRFDELPPAP